jgi:hypothetical protein
MSPDKMSRDKMSLFLMQQNVTRQNVAHGKMSPQNVANVAAIFLQFFPSASVDFDDISMPLVPTYFYQAYF